MTFVSEKESYRRVIVFGFGEVACPTLQIMAKTFPMNNYILVDKERISDEQISFFGNKNVSRVEKKIEPVELYSEASKLIRDNDIVLDFYGMNETLDILHAVYNKKNVIYINASLEEDESELRPTQYDLYEAFENFRKKFPFKSSAVIDTGANPGLITHFAIMGIYGMAKSAIERKVSDYKEIEKLLNKKDLPSLAKQLKLEVIHISENEEMTPNNPDLFKDKIISSWCVDSFICEWNIPAEVSCGTHDREIFKKLEGYRIIEEAKPPTVVCPLSVYSLSAVPSGIFTGKVIMHPETIEISQIFSSKEHIPTVSFVYRPSSVTRKSAKNENWSSLPLLSFNEKNAGPLQGKEVMGATLISSRDDIPIRWYGSEITCEDERKLGFGSNPTVLQVAAGVISHLIIELEEPEKGLCLPHDFDSEKVMEYAKPYLGTIHDLDLPFKLPTSWEKLLSTEEKMD